MLTSVLLALRTYLSYQITTATLNDRKVAKKFFKGIFYYIGKNDKPSQNINTQRNISPPSNSIPPPTVVAIVGFVLAVYVDSVASVASVASVVDVTGDADGRVRSVVLLDGVGVGVLLADSSVGALVSAVETDAVEVNSVLEEVVSVGDGEVDAEVDDEETSVEYVAAVVGTFGLFSCLQRASRRHGGHMCGERQRSAVFDIVS